MINSYPRLKDEPKKGATLIRQLKNSLISTTGTCETMGTDEEKKCITNICIYKRDYCEQNSEYTKEKIEIY